jgi:hypothetical protein
MGHELAGVPLKSDSLCEVRVVFLVLDGVSFSASDAELLREVKREDTGASVYLEKDRVT